MTHRDYVKIAAVLRRNLHGTTPRTVEIITAITIDLANIFEAENPRFERRRFYNATGVFDGVVGKRDG